ncbi:MAG: serine/threonine-protein kinase [Acidimicrobiales bacterium]
MTELSGEDLGAVVDGQTGRPAAEIERDLAIPSLTQLRLLSAGPSASVFRAYQVATQRTVAVKVLHDELSSDVGQRFDRERAITGQLSGHTGIVPLLHTGTTADGEPYLVLPFYHRGSLADLMTRYGRLPWREASFLIKPVASTVAEVHLWGLVHRNVKPSNVLLTDFLRPRVADFGMCLPSDQPSTPATLVTGPYAPPEAAFSGPTDPTMDVYGLGATLWALLAGRSVPSELDGERERRRPGASDVGLATGRLGRSSPPDLPTDDTPPRIADLIERSMSPHLADRPATVAAFIAELGQADTALSASVAGAGSGSGSTAGSISAAAASERHDHNTERTTPAATTTATPSPPAATETSSTQRDHDDPASGVHPNESNVPPASSPPEPDDPAVNEVSTADAVVPPVDLEGGIDDLSETPTISANNSANDGGASVATSSVGNDRRPDDRSSADSRVRSERVAPVNAKPARSGSSDVYYLLGLVALISTGIIVMIAAAILAFQ